MHKLERIYEIFSYEFFKGNWSEVYDEKYDGYIKENNILNRISYLSKNSAQFVDKKLGKSLALIKYQKRYIVYKYRFTGNNKNDYLRDVVEKLENLTLGDAFREFIEYFEDEI